MRQLYPILLLGVFFLNSFGQAPQTAPPKHPRPEEVGENDILRVDTTLVGVPVTVMDREGRFVPGLKREDFHIYEDGVEQQIANFASVEANVTVLLLFDHFVKNYRETARAFAERLGAGDKVLVARFGDPKYEILTKVGEGPAGVQKERKEVKWRFARGIHDAVDAAIRRMTTVPGRKAILLFSDGIYHTTLISFTNGHFTSMRVKKPVERATAAGTLRGAEESDAPFYVMRYDTMRDVVRDGPKRKNPEWVNAMLVNNRNEYRIADEYLHALAEKSGGRLYQVASGPRDRQIDNPPNLTESFAQISAELRQQYILGYYPKPENKAKELHQIKVRVARPDVAVRSRTSYIPVSSKP